MYVKRRTAQELEDAYGMSNEQRLHRARVKHASGVRTPDVLETIERLSPLEKKGKFNLQPQPPVEPIVPRRLLN